jgi:hypothetical protein
MSTASTDDTHEGRRSTFEFNTSLFRERALGGDPRIDPGADPIQRVLGEQYDYAVANRRNGQTIQFWPKDEHLGPIPSQALRDYLVTTVNVNLDVNSLPTGLLVFDETRGVITEQDLEWEGSTVGPALTAALTSALPTSVAALVTDAKAALREATIWRLQARRGESGREQIVAFERLRAEHKAKTAANFEKFRNANSTTERLIPTLPFVGHGFASSRRWGIEIESGGARGVGAPAGFDRKSDGSLRSAWQGYVEVQDFEPHMETKYRLVPWRECDDRAKHVITETYDEELQEYINVIPDGYLDPRQCAKCGKVEYEEWVEPQTITHRAQNDDCAEFVSTILTSMHSNGLETLLGEISKQPQNDTAGVHVHVEANTLSQKQLSTLIYGYDMIERFIEPSYQRTRRDYCNRRPARQVLEAARIAVEGGEAPVGDRYVTVNLHALRRHGTVEFRAMGPVYDYNYLIRWAMFCREIVNVVEAGATREEFGRIKKWEDLLKLFVKYGKEFVRALAHTAEAEVPAAPRLAKVVDGVSMPTAAEAIEQRVIGGFAVSMADFERQVQEVPDLVAV